MNERIKELAEQAGAHFGEGSEFAVVFGEVSDFEKFAELIVRECISALDKEVYLATREDGEQAFHDVILLEHFGVEL